MTCDAARNRLLAPPTPGRLPDDVRGHLAGCAGCRQFRDHAAAVDAELAALPAPPADAAKAAFLDSLLAAGPVIRTVPAVPAQGGWSVRPVLARVGWRPPLATAAAALIGLGVWSAWPARTKLPAEVPGPRSELVRKVIDHQTALARATDPRERMARLTALATDLRAEAAGVALADDGSETRSIEKMFRAVLADGLVPQAGGLKAVGPAERRAALDRAVAELAAAAVVLDSLPAAAGAKGHLARMADDARSAQAELYKLSKGDAWTMPRLAATAVGIVAVAAWASAQPPAAVPIAADRLRLFHRNRDLLEALVTRAVEASRADTPLARAAACRETAAALASELQKAAGENDPDRVCEVGEYLTAVLTDALTPTFDAARASVLAGTPDRDKLTELHTQADADAAAAEGSIPRIGRVGQSARAADARRKLADARQKLADVRP